MKLLPGKKLHVILLVLVLAIGLVMRLRDVGGPPIGYHSMKEVHYLSVARGYLEQGDFLHKRVPYSGMSGGPGYIEGLAQFQFLPLILFGLWKIFGVQLWIARLVVIAFSLGCVAMIHLVGRRLAARDEIPLLAALFMSILPVSVFFGRNVQPDAPALFFALFATWAFLAWMESRRGRHLFLFSLGAFAAMMIKGTFLVMLLPLPLLFPFGRLGKRDERRAIMRQASWFAPGVILAAAWLVFTRATQTSEGSIFPLDRLFLGEALTIAYWKPQLRLLWRYAGENYTYVLFALFVMGLAASVADLRRPVSRYIAGSFAAAVLYFVLISDFAVRHSYYQMPFLPMVVLGIAGVLSDWMSFVASRTPGRAWPAWLVPAAVIAFVSPSVKGRVDGHFDRQMIGCDVAGRYIGEHAGPDDRIFISYGSPSDRRFTAWRTQYYGILWEAGRRGSLLPADSERVRFGEAERNMRWIVMYRTEWLERDRELLDYIRGGYSIRQIGYADGDILYYVLEKGGAFDPSAFDGIEPAYVRSYRFGGGRIELSVKEAPEPVWQDEPAP